MLTDYANLDAELLCPVCRGTGVVTAKNTETRGDLGRYCTECDAGRRRWDATMKALAEEDSLKRTLNHAYAQA